MNAVLLKFAPTQRSGSRERASTILESAVVTRNSSRRAPPNVAARLGPSGPSATIATTVPAPLPTGAAITAETRPVTGSRKGATIIGSRSPRGSQPAEPYTAPFEVGCEAHLTDPSGETMSRCPVEKGPAPKVRLHGPTGAARIEANCGFEDSFAEVSSRRRRK